MLSFCLPACLLFLLRPLYSSATLLAPSAPQVALCRVARSRRSQMLYIPLGDANTPCLRSSLSTLSCPWAGCSNANSSTVRFWLAAVLRVRLVLADFSKDCLAAGVAQTLEPVETVAGIAHYLASSKLSPFALMISCWFATFCSLSQKRVCFSDKRQVLS